MPKTTWTMYKGRPVRVRILEYGVASPGNPDIKVQVQEKDCHDTIVCYISDLHNSREAVLLADARKQLDMLKCWMRNLPDLNTERWQTWDGN